MEKRHKQLQDWRATEAKAKSKPKAGPGNSRVKYPDKLCKHIAAGKVCPDGKNCLYSHDKMHFDDKGKPKVKSAKSDFTTGVDSMQEESEWKTVGSKKVRQ